MRFVFVFCSGGRVVTLLGLHSRFFSTTYLEFDGFIPKDEIAKSWKKGSVSVFSDTIVGFPLRAAFRCS